MHNTSSEKKSSEQSGKTHQFSPDIGGMGTIQYRVGATHSRDDPAGGIAADASAEMSPLNVFEEAEKLDTQIAIREALLKTGVKKNIEIVYLYFWEDMLMDEIGEVYGITRERVGQIIRETLGKLRRILER
jgi:RNA polymerase sigma factor (sigma-70 family)